MSFLKRTPGESKEEAREERKVEIDKPPAPKLTEEQRPMLDWLKEEDKKKITALIHAYFDDGLTNGNDVYARLTSPDIETGVKNITPRIISGLYGMWQRWKSPETQRSKEDEEVTDKKMRELEARLISRFDKALSKVTEKEIDESEEPAEDEELDSEIDSDTRRKVNRSFRIASPKIVRDAVEIDAGTMIQWCETNVK